MKDLEYKDYQIVAEYTDEPGTFQWNTMLLVLGIFLAAILPLWLIYDIPRLKYELINLSEISIIFPVLVGGVLLHEGLHLLGWKLSGNIPWRFFTLGINWQALAPYAHCKRPVKWVPYLIGTLLPFFLLGLGPYVVGLFLGEFLLLYGGILFSLVSGGDIRSAWQLRNFNLGTWVQDHPDKPGFLIVKPKKKGKEF